MSKLQIVSFNMRFPNEKDGENYFFNRLPLIKESICRRNPDIIGAQEVTDESRDALVQALPQYALVGSGRNNDRHGEGVAFLYRKDKFELADLSCRWLSETPHVPGSRYGEESGQSNCPRVLLTALFVPKDRTMSPFRIYNIHTDHAGTIARNLASQELIRRVHQDLAQDPLPYFVLGDFNAIPTDEAIQMLKNEKELFEDVTQDIRTTFHDFGRKCCECIKIDYIFASKQPEHIETTLWTETQSGLYLSDHHPVEAVFSL